MDNYFKNCVAVMSDGRQFTDWKGATRRNEYIKYINEVLRDDDYRMLLQCNGSKFMDKEWEYYSKKLNCWENQCIHNYPTRTLPQFFKQELKAFNDKMDPSKPKLKNTCPQFRDYRLNTNERGLTCDNNLDKMTRTKSFDPSELISNITQQETNIPLKVQASASTEIRPVIPVGMESVQNYAPVMETVPKVRSNNNALIYDPQNLNKVDNQQEYDSEDSSESTDE